jgi:hypothetical protein
MVYERTEFGFKRIECACSACLRNCYGLQGYLVPADLRRIADYLGEDDIVRFALDNLLASPGALVVAHGEIFAIPTIVPARRPDGACRFLKNNLCSCGACVLSLLVSTVLSRPEFTCPCAEVAKRVMAITARVIVPCLWLDMIFSLLEAYRGAATSDDSGVPSSR